MERSAVILAAGLGTRMRSALPKAQHPLGGRPMLLHLLDTAARAFDRVTVVLGPGMEALAAMAAPHGVVVQQERLGTAHAALQAADAFGDGIVAILYADSPLIEAATLGRLAAAVDSGAALALAAMRPADPGRYGRIVTRGETVERIVEWADATPEERAIPLCNGGAMAARGPALGAWLREVRPHNAQGEYYLTDVVAIARAAGAPVAAVPAAEEELRGINSRAELAEAEAVLQRRLRRAAMEAGVTMTAPETVFLSWDTRLGPDTSIGPNVVFGPGVSVEGPAEILGFSHLAGCVVEAGAVIGPFARLRPGTQVRRGAHVGNFVELKAAVLGEGAKANHLAYLGDADIGARSNIGAGTIICNYDGFRKHRTRIGEGVFVGSDSVLVAPVDLGDGCFVAAGSVITANVSPDAMAFGRTRQQEVPGRAAAFRAARRNKETG